MIEVNYNNFVGEFIELEDSRDIEMEICNRICEIISNANNDYLYRALDEDSSSYVGCANRFSLHFNDL